MIPLTPWIRHLARREQCDEDDAGPLLHEIPAVVRPSSFSLIRAVWTADPHGASAWHLGSEGYCLPGLGNDEVIAVFPLNRYGMLDVEWTHRMKLKVRRVFEEQR